MMRTQPYGWEVRMCPVHWATFALAALPAALGVLSLLGLRLRRPGARPSGGGA